MNFTFHDYGVVVFEDENVLMQFLPFGSRFSTAVYTSIPASDGSIKDWDALTKAIEKYQPSIFRDKEEYILSICKIKNTASDTIGIPGWFIDATSKTKRVVSAIHRGAAPNNIYEPVSKIRHIIVGDGIRYIPSGFFNEFKNLQHVNLPETVESISWYGFAELGQLTDIDLPHKITVINACTFIDCSNLESVGLPQSLLAIADRAFERTGLKAVVIPDQTEIIAQRAFADCKSLKQVILPDSLYYIADDAFEGCPEDICFLVPRFSYAERWADECWFTYRFID